MLATISIPAALISIRSSLADNLKRLGYHLTEEELDDAARNIATAVVTLDADTKPTPMSRLERAARRWRDDPDAFQRQADLIHAVDRRHELARMGNYDVQMPPGVTYDLIDGEFS